MPPLEASNALAFIARLKTGMSLAQADARLRVLGAGIISTLPPENRIGGTLTARPLSNAMLWSYSKNTLWVMIVMAGIFLFIACANSANLLLAWATARQGEIGVRLAIGATRSQLIRQLLTESAVFSVIATAIGFTFAMWARKAIDSAISFSGTPAVLNFSLDGKLVAFVIGLTLICTLLSGLSPAMMATRISPHSVINGSARMGKRGSWFSNSVLIVVQVALSVAVFVSACLLARTYDHLLAKDPGYDAKGVLVARVSTTETDSRRAAFESDDLLEAFRHTPGVVSASRFANPPQNTLMQIGIPQASDSVFLARAFPFVISSDYFRTRRTPILAGRDFNVSDTEDSPPVAILSEQAAKRFFKGTNPIGLSFREKDAGTAGEERTVRIVGVAKNIDFQRPQDAPILVVFRPVSQCAQCYPMGRYEIRYTGSATTLTAHLKASASAVASNLSIEFHSLDDEISSRLGLNRAIALLAALFAAIVGLLVAIGIFAMTSYAAAQRTREIGIRMALGARRENVLRMILRDSLSAVVVGAMVGVPAALGSVQALRGMLWGVEPTDLRSFTVAVWLVLLAAGTAAYLPARRAVRSNPIECLREE
jgi:putative ABC transport system permease protein